MLTDTVEVVRLSPALGGEIRGVDLRHSIDAPAKAFLNAAWNESLVIVIRGVTGFAANDHIEFCRAFGEIGARARPPSTRNEPADAPDDVMYVSNRRENGKFIGSLPEGEMQFHIDQCYIERPAMAGCLYALEVPDVGGDTMFGNLYLAWETLAPEFKRIVAGRNAVHVFDHGTYGTQTRDANTAAPPNAQRYAHPIVRTHPATGRKLLYVNRLMTERIEGLPADESNDVLMKLFDHQERPELLYTHIWQRGDLLLWDNRCTIHARTDFDSSKPRHLRRFTIRGQKPV